MATGVRLSAEERRGQIMRAARALVIAQGYLPLALERLAGEVGVSKALVYSYFPDQADLFNAILAEDLAELEAGLEAAARLEDLEAAAEACAGVYFRHICAHGPALHVILRDQYMSRRLSRPAAARRDRIALCLARRARRAFGLPAREAVGAFTLILAVPEEAGRLVWQGELSAESGEELCARLVRAAVQGLAGLSPAPSDGR